MSDASSKFEYEVTHGVAMVLVLITSMLALSFVMAAEDLIGHICLWRVGKRVRAHVTEIVIEGVGDGSFNRPKVCYDFELRTITTLVKGTQVGEPYEVGQALELLVDPRQPEVCRFGGFNGFVGPVFALAVSIFLIGTVLSGTLSSASK